MKVFKFGGASVKDAEAVKNVAAVLRHYEGEALLIVVSAMGKTTNALERLVKAYVEDKKAEVQSVYSEIKSFHDGIVAGLLKQERSHAYDDIENLFIELECLLETQAEGDYDYLYDQIVSYGEVFSSRIVHTYLNETGLSNRWVDARNFIQTFEGNYREGKVDWELTSGIIARKLKPIVQKQRVLTQGFIAQTPDKQTITLGREGSDYSAAIMAYGLDAESVTIWKDVAGVMNADPKRMPDAKKVDGLNYQVAIELAYYGATVIHPKTIQPLQSKGIPLFVKSFLDPQAAGTEVSTTAENSLIPFYIFKEHQAFLQISSRDFSFIAEEHLTHIFSVMSAHRVKVNLMQNSAISFSLVLNTDGNKLPELVNDLKKDYNVTVEAETQLLTIRNYAEADITGMVAGRKIWMEQRSGKVLQLVLGA